MPRTNPQDRVIQELIIEIVQRVADRFAGRLDSAQNRKSYKAILRAHLRALVELDHHRIEDLVVGAQSVAMGINTHPPPHDEHPRFDVDDCRRPLTLAVVAVEVLNTFVDKYRETV